MANKKEGLIIYYKRGWPFGKMSMFCQACNVKIVKEQNGEFVCPKCKQAIKTEQWGCKYGFP